MVHMKQAMFLSQQLMTTEQKLGPTIDNYAKDGGPEVVWHLCSFYQDPLRS